MNFNLHNYKITGKIPAGGIAAFYQKQHPFVDTGLFALFKSFLMVYRLSQKPLKK